MNTQPSVLSLVPALRRGAVLPHGSYRTQVEFLEFVIDDVRFGEERGVRRLLDQTPAELPDERVALYVCPECGDLGCGAVTVTIRRTGNEVVWADPGWQTDYEPEVDVEGFEGLGPFRFEGRQYDTLLASLLH
jgi:hypothetical protein